MFKTLASILGLFLLIPVYVVALAWGESIAHLIFSEEINANNSLLIMIIIPVTIGVIILMGGQIEAKLHNWFFRIRPPASRRKQ